MFVRKWLQGTIKQQWLERIAGCLLSFSVKNNKPIDWENALSYPLSPIFLCLSTADGKPRKTVKIKLQEIVLKEGDSTIVNNPQEVDLMAVLRSLVQIPEKYEELI